MKLHSILFSLFILFLGNTFSNAQNVSIPDANLKAVLVADTRINTNGDAEIQVSEAVAFKDTIIANNKSISDLTGIESFINLTGLNCSGNQIFILDTHYNKALEYLDVSYNQLTSLNVKANTFLLYLDCKINLLTDLDVDTNKHLKFLSCQWNKLTKLNISYNVSLEELYCNKNAITALDVSSNTKLKTLSCFTNQINDLDVSANTMIEYLVCYENQITELDVSSNTKLETLNCHTNQIKNLDVSANTALSGLFCGGNQITTLDVSANTLLSGFSCSKNNLTSLNVSANTRLSSLYCNDNQLISLDVSTCKILNTLMCESNQLTNLNVRNGNTLREYYWIFSAVNNPHLKCIQVNQANSSTVYWSQYVDHGAMFSESCTVGTEDSLSQAEISFYPNPSNGIFTISGLPTKKLTIELFSMAGEKVYSAASLQTNHRVDISGCAKGIYFLNISQGATIFTQKIEIR